MSREMISPPYRQNDPSPGGYRRRGRRVLIFIVILLLGIYLLVTGRDLQTVLITLISLGLASATVARWVADDGPLPSLTAMLSRVTGPGSDE
jgi:drug/metabolite transporter (DMT)-like permease